MSFSKKKKGPQPVDPLRQFRSPEVGPSDHRKVFSHETEAAGLIGGRRHAGSGAKTGLKSDGSSDRYQLECKQTAHQSLSVSTEWLQKISREAIGKSRIPMLHIRFLNPPRDMLDRDWVCVPANEFHKIFDLASDGDPTLGRWKGY